MTEIVADEPQVEVAVATPPKREPQLKTITAIENVVNEYARTVVKKAKWGIKDDEFVVLLSRRFKGIMGLQRGHPVQITLAWPEAQQHLNTLLHEAFSTIHRHKMVDVWAVEKVAHIRARNVESKKWRREKFGVLGEIIGELIPKKYITVTNETTSIIKQTIRDNMSGVVIEKTWTTSETKTEDGRVLDVKTWLELSRLVRDKEEAEPNDDTGDEGEVEGTQTA
jgi:hypothetical protein